MCGNATTDNDDPASLEQPMHVILAEHPIWRLALQLLLDADYIRHSDAQYRAYKEMIWGPTAPVMSMARGTSSGVKVKWYKRIWYWLWR